MSARAAGDVELAGLALRVALGSHRADGAPVREPDLRAEGGVRPNEGRRIEDPGLVAPQVDLDVDSDRAGGAGCRSRGTLSRAWGRARLRCRPPRSGSGWASARAPPGPACRVGLGWARAWVRSLRAAAGPAASGFRSGSEPQPHGQQAGRGEQRPERPRRRTSRHMDTLTRGRAGCQGRCERHHRSATTSPQTPSRVQAL